MQTDNSNTEQEKKATNTSLPPAIPGTSAEMEVLRRLVERMVENERQRVRNQYLQLAIVILLLLFALVGTGIWFAHQLFTNVRYERMLLEQKREASTSSVLTPETKITQIVPAISDIETKTKEIERKLLAGTQSDEVKELLLKQQEELNRLYAQVATLQKAANEKIIKEAIPDEDLNNVSSPKQISSPNNNIPGDKTNKRQSYLTIKMTNSPATMRIPLQLPAR